MMLVHCARVPASLSAELLAKWVDLLPWAPDDGSLARDKGRRRIESLTGMALLASFSLACKLPPLESLRRTSLGKPRFPDGPEFSITHAGGFAVCAVAPGGQNVGVDAEPAGRARLQAVWQVADEAEKTALAAGLMTATELWTAKEAVIKAVGAGLADIGCVSVLGRRARFRGTTFHLRRFRLKERLVLTVATSQRIAALKIRWIAPSELFR
jgi:4'-phosphopantetheinyl transferase EntD